MLMQLLKIIKLYMNCGIIAVVIGIILSIIDNFLSTAFMLSSIIGKSLSI